MSTTFEIGRMPGRDEPAFNQAGDSPIVTPANVRAMKRGQAARSSIASANVSSPSRAGSMPGIGRSVAPVSACTSRAIPYTDVRSGRL